MKKKLLSLLLAVTLLASAVPRAFAAEVVPIETAARTLAALDIMVGFEDGQLHLEQKVTRAQFVKIAIAASPYRDMAGKAATVSPYPDVPRNHWAAGYVQTAVSVGLISGYPDGTFRPDSTITLLEGVTIVLRLLGYSDSDFTFPTGQMAMYRNLKLDLGISIGQNDLMTRQDCMYLAYNLLTTPNSKGVVHITTMGYPLTAAGEIDLVSLINAAMEGPILVEGSWQQSIPFDAPTAAVTRGGQSASFGDIKSGDVVYYVDSMRSIWAYHNQVTGTYDRAVPSTASPTSIVIAGQSYSFETSAAAYDLSDLGKYRPGDTVTLYLGRTGGIAAVRDAQEGTKIVYGVVTGTTNATYTNANGDSYSAPTAALLATDGATYSYQYSGKNLSVGNLAQVTVTEAGTTLAKLSSTSIAGTVNANGTAIGNTAFSPNIEILDTYGDTTAATVHSNRLADVKLTSSMVRFYATNTNGQITHLILDNVTGDLQQYGVVTESNAISLSSSLGLTVSSQYVYDIGGTPGFYSSSTKSFGKFTGPFALISDKGVAERVQALKSRAITSVDGLVAYHNGAAYKLAEGYLVYEKRGTDFYLTTWSQVEGGDYTFTAWYDKAENEGGRIRVILATAKK